MSLQVWMPLNGNINNQGLSEITPSGTPKYYANGKMSSQCLDMSSAITATASGLTGATEWSAAFWYKIDNNDSLSKDWVRALSLEDETADNSTIGGFRFETCYSSSASSQNKGLHWHNNSLNATVSDYAYISYDREIWHHACITVSPTKGIHTYCDGTLVHTSSKSHNGGHLTGYFKIGYSNLISGGIQDIRLYDHALSAKEVAEIAKGLILHYKLDHNGAGGANMVNNSAPTELLESDELEKWNLYLSDNWIMNLVNCEGSPSGKCIQVTATTDFITADGGNYGGGVFKRPPKSTDFVDGQKYTISAYIRSNVDGLKIKFCNEMMKSHGTPIALSTEWKYYSYTCDININNPYYANVFYVADVSQIHTGTCIEVHSLKLEKGSRATPWIPSSADSIYTELGFNTTEEPDCSGFGNNGTMVGSFNYDTDSPRYMSSTIFNGIDTYIVAGTGVKVKDEITVALWAYMDDWTEFTVNENHRFISCTEDGGWNFQPTTNDYIYFIIGTGSESNTYKSAHTNVKLANMTSGWHHFVGTFNGISVKMYMDGVLKNTGSAYSEKTPIFYNANNGIFVGAEAGPSNIEPIAHVDESFNGKMSDLRIYATALTDTQVKELYNSSAAIDNKNNLFCYEIEER